MNKDDADGSKVMTVRGVAAYLHCHASSIYRMLKRREIPGYKLGSDWRFNIESIDKWRMEMEAKGEYVA